MLSKHVLIKEMKPLLVDGAQRPENHGGFLPRSAPCRIAIFLLKDRDTFSWRAGNDCDLCDSEAADARCIRVPKCNGLVLDRAFHDRPVSGTQAIAV